MEYHPLTLATAADLIPYAIRGLTASKIYSTLVNSVTSPGGATRRASFPAGTDLTTISPGVVVYLSGGLTRANSGAHIVTAVDTVGFTIDYEDTEGADEAGPTGKTASFYQMDLFPLDQIIRSEVLPYLESQTGFSLDDISEVTEYHSGTGKSEMLLDRRPILDVLRVEFLTLPADVLSIPAQSIEVLSRQGIIRVKATNLESFNLLSPAFPRGRNNIKVTYRIGWAPGSLPPEIFRAAVLLAGARVLAEAAGASGDPESLSVVQWSASYGSKGKWAKIRRDRIFQARAQLKKYRSGVVGN